MNAPPKLLTREDIAMMQNFPVLVLTDNLWSWLAAGIRRHTEGRYSHAMMMHRAGMVASQDRRFEERPIDDYLGGRHRVKFWEGPWSPRQRAMMQAMIRAQIAQRGRYDWLGVIGQLLRLPWVQSRNRLYCSEATAHVLAIGQPDFHNMHPTPAYINQHCKKDDSMMRCRGVFDPGL